MYVPVHTYCILLELQMGSKGSQASSPPSRWWSEETIAVVTGGNRGIGFAFVRCLAEHGLTVILTARDTKKGIKAVESLRAQGLRVQFCGLDVADPTSINRFASWLRESFGRLDILVNNAAVSFKEIYENSVDHAETVIRTNYYGPKLLMEALLPLFHRSASMGRILNISSRLGVLNKVTDPTVRDTLQDEERLSEKSIDDLIRRFLDQVKNNTWQHEGWPKQWTDYSVSKLALNAYSRVVAKQYEGRGLSVNCFCPGFTQTAMTGGQGKYTAEEAAEVGAHLVLLPPDKLPTGKFFVGCKPFLYSKL